MRKLQVMKMRGVASVPGLHTFRITDAGIQVFPRVIVGPDAPSPATTESAPVVGGSENDEEADAEPEPDSGEDTPSPTGATTEQAIEACKQGVQTSAQQLSGELRADLEEICEESATGEEAYGS